MGLIPLSDKNEKSGTSRGLWDPLKKKWKSKTKKKKRHLRADNAEKSKADFTVREIYFANISKRTAFLLQRVFLVSFKTDCMAKDVAI